MSDTHRELLENRDPRTGHRSSSRGTACPTSWDLEGSCPALGQPLAASGGSWLPRSEPRPGSVPLLTARERGSRAGNELSSVMDNVPVPSTGKTRKPFKPVDNLQAT